MGKKIIIRGADFSANGMESVTEGTMTVVNGAVSVNSDSDTCGMWYPGSSRTTRGGIAELIYIEYGQKITILDLGTSPNCLRIDGCYYSSQAGGVDNCLGTLCGGVSTDAESTYLINADGTKDSITIENTWVDAWFRFAFAKGVSKSDTITTQTLRYKLT